MPKTLIAPALAFDPEALIGALPPLIRPLAQRGTVHRFSAGERIVGEGDHGDALYIVLAGRVRAYSRDLFEREVTYCIDTAGECFGEMALDGGARSASVEALEDAVVSAVTRITVLRHISEEPEFGIHLLLRVIGRAREATERARAMALDDVYSRLKRLLEKLAIADENGARIIPEPLTHNALGSRVGASREMISRLMKALETGGYVHTEDKRINLLRPLPMRF